MNSLQQPKLKKSHMVGISITLIVVGIGIWLSIAAWKKSWPFNNKDKTCTPGPGETVIGAATYITNDDDDCVANTCNTLAGYDLTPVNSMCMPDDAHTQYATLDDELPCTRSSTKSTNSRCYLQDVADHPYTVDDKDDYQKKFCKSGKAIVCPAGTNKAVGKDKKTAHWYCGDLDADTFCNSSS